ncbi:hypothetical protein SAMD00019534_073530 [Acytostelium subglobosum LB1]|uniref:hypothetical protein n=1 Tax=Acytostelium subglobosum LB1 TaxID=1410327 RepID=UPI000644C357|nr:hypothetical protein SAMD00019534_073530 [Acytostelium subglobosum LB1]GAM24178.1 hypothetical protein SAMD00019534_073530 [Acytostelium subglobosum LB1]|eukprot:XP_012753214.1 hypothetical protein SAMD00019534_073530 [Acytostelium subglobosum LB1]
MDEEPTNNDDVDAQATGAAATTAVDYVLPEDSELDQCPQQKTFVKEAEELKQLIDMIALSINGPLDQLDTATSRIIAVLEQYQEQSNLLDMHLVGMVTPLIQVIRTYIMARHEQQEVSVSSSTRPPANLSHCYRLLYFLTKVRGYKTIVKLLPHSVVELLPTASLLEQRTILFLNSPHAQALDIQMQNEQQKEHRDTDMVSWEELYVLSLWLSLLIIIPFKFTSIDGRTTNDVESLASRVIALAKKALTHHSKIQESFSELLSRLLARPDMTSNLQAFIDWCSRSMSDIRQRRSAHITDHVDIHLYKGVLLTLTSIYKKGDRAALLPLNQTLYQMVVQGLDPTRTPLDIERMCKQLLVKLLQRMGLILLPPITATWRYQRIIKPLLATQQQINFSESDHNQSQSKLDDDGAEDEQDIPEEIEEIIELLISEGLGDRDTIVRWTSAKGVGRVVNLLSKDMGGQVIESVLQLFDNVDSDSAWHGGCLAMAELCRRGLILPDRLAQLIPIVVKALYFDVQRGNSSVGYNVRDAACYISWALARTYHPSIMSPYSYLLAQHLVVMSLFDREINCRKSASAAYQENVGRQGAAIPHGIDIVQMADYFSVGNRRNAYLVLAPEIATFVEYRPAIISHLLQTKIYHWDADIRELATRTLALVVPLDTRAIVDSLPKVIAATKLDQIPSKHGALLALHEILIALNSINQSILLSDDITNSILAVIKDKRLERLYKGKGGVLIRTGICKLIRSVCLCQFSLFREIKDETSTSNASTSLRDKIQMMKAKASKLPASTPGSRNTSTPSITQTTNPTTTASATASGLNAFETLYSYLLECIQHPHEDVQQQASMALEVLFKNYMVSDTAKIEQLATLVTKYISLLHSDPNYATRRGASLLLGVLPYQLLQTHPNLLHSVIDALVKSLFEERPQLKDMETRVNSLSSLHNISKSLYQHKLIDGPTLEALLSALMRATQDYSIDKRGDVGSWVRESSIKIIDTLITQEVETLLPQGFVERYMCKLIQIAGEKLDKLRMTSCTILSSLLWRAPQLVPDSAQLQSIFKQDLEITWSRSIEAFPIICKVLAIDRYIYPLLFGLLSSIGGSTKYLVDDSIDSIKLYLNEPDDVKTKQQNIVRIATTLVTILEHIRERPLLATFKAMTILFQTNEFDTLVSSQPDIINSIFSKLHKEYRSIKDIVLLMASVPLFAYFTNDCFDNTKRIANEVLIHLMKHEYPRVRMSAAEAILIRYKDAQTIVTLISGTRWEQTIDNNIIDQLCLQLGITSSPTINNTNVPTATLNDDHQKEVPTGIPVVTSYDALPEDSEDLMEI